MALITLNVSQDGDDEVVTNTLTSLIESVNAIEGAAVEGFGVEPETWAQSDSGKEFTEQWNTRSQVPSGKGSTTETAPASAAETGTTKDRPSSTDKDKPASGSTSGV